MAASQLVVVVEHGSLQLEPLFNEGHVLDLALFLDSAHIIFRKRSDILSDPNVGAGSNLLVSVDFLLLVAPIGKRLGVSPHSNLAGEVNKLEVAGDRLEVLLILAMINANLKQRIVLTSAKSILLRSSGEFLVGRIVRRSNIVGQEDGISDHMLKANQVIVQYRAASLLVVAGGENLPVVVGIVEGITSDLLTLAGNAAIIVAKRVVLGVAVEVGFGLLVADGDDIVVVDVDGIG